MFDALKHAAGFAFDFSEKCGVQTGRIVEMKAKIDALTLDFGGLLSLLPEKLAELNSEFVHRYKNDLFSGNIESLQETHANRSFREIPYEEVSLYSLIYNADLALRKVQQRLEQYRCTGSREDHLHRANERAPSTKRRPRGEDRNDEGRGSGRLFNVFKEPSFQLLRDQLAQLGKESKENRKKSVSFLPNSSMIAGTESPDEMPTTAEDFLVTFEKIYEKSDTLVQMIKSIIIQAQPNSARAVLEEARLLRQFLNEVLLIFRKAKANPAVR
jgi:hypothetical protein